jgi:cytochrome c biogenesis protein CcmG/thiol:disulfide interchange protein DsbE
MKPSPVRTALASLALLAGLIAPARANDLVVGKPAPPVTLTTLDGQHFSTPGLTGKVVLVTFWATWCAPCQEELPMLSDYAREHAAQGLQVLSISLDTPDRLNQVKALAARFSFPVGMISDASAPGYGRIWHLPVSFVIDRQGRLVEDGWKEDDPVLTRDKLDRLVGPLLAGH